MSTLTPNSNEEVNELLAYAIPALSFGSGGAVVNGFVKTNKEINMNSYPVADGGFDWPGERPLDRHPITQEPRLWRHSDFKDVAYRYVYKLYDEMAFRGNIK